MIIKHLSLKSMLKMGLGLCLFWATTLSVMAQKRLVVAADGTGQFTSIQAAINSLSDSSKTQREIFIKKGVYREKIFLSKSNITLKGEKAPKWGGAWTDTEGVKIIFSESREIFRCQNPDDWGAATINIRTHDIRLENLMVVNDFGFMLQHDSVFVCKGVSKVTRKDGHQFALRCMPTTQRLTVLNCNFHALGGDTVSPWDADNGTFVFKNCTMEGNVDFYCPRGWAYAERCYFICHNLNAAIWHDGTGNESAKTVLKDCYFRGEAGFKLGRFHRDAQFYLVNCTFSKEMADAPIYKVRKDTVLQWETRVYYYNCHREGGDFQWHKDNIDKKTAQKINRNWTLAHEWNRPARAMAVKSDYGLPPVANAPQQVATDAVAERMCTAQRSVGGWAKTLDGKTQPPPYNEEWSAAQMAAIADEAGRNDATIDNSATTREIRHLAKAYTQTKNEKYRLAAEKGINYLIKMQYENGGFPQFFPDTSGYRKHITFNDNAMVRALEVLRDVAEAKTPFEEVGVTQRAAAQNALDKGIDCILKTQIIQNGRPTIWCAQHDYKSFLPTKARSFELPSFSGSESVGILNFLIALKNPTPSVKAAVVAGVAFLDTLMLKGVKVERLKDARQPTGETISVTKAADAPPIWARFYDLETRQPFFCGRDGVKKSQLAEIENERQVHYAWYGDWAADLLAKKYPKWREKHMK